MQKYRTLLEIGTEHGRIRDPEGGNSEPGTRTRLRRLEEPSGLETGDSDESPYGLFQNLSVGRVPAEGGCSSEEFVVKERGGSARVGAATRIQTEGIVDDERR